MFPFSTCRHLASTGQVPNGKYEPLKTFSELLFQKICVQFFDNLIWTSCERFLLMYSALFCPNGRMSPVSPQYSLACWWQHVASWIWKALTVQHHCLCRNVCLNVVTGQICSVRALRLIPDTLSLLCFQLLPPGQTMKGKVLKSIWKEK